MGGGAGFGASTFSNKNDDPFAELINDSNASTGLGGASNSSGFA